MNEGPAAADPKRVIIADPLLPDGIQLLRDTDGLVVEDHTDSNRETLAQALKVASALIVRSRTKVDASLVEQAGSLIQETGLLEVIGRAGAGVDNIDMDAATRAGIAVFNAPAANTRSTAELTFGLLLAAVRRLAEADASVRRGEWKRGQIRGIQLSGKTLGVIGLGRIGSAVAARARAFGMRIVAHDPFVDAQRAHDMGLDLVGIDKLLRKSDVVTLHVPLRDDNRGLIGREQIAGMPPGSILVNAARGGLVDESALAEALKSGHLAAAGIDVFEKEPLPADSPLREAPHIVFSPHLGASTLEAQREVSLQIAATIRKALVEKDLRQALNAPFETGSESGDGSVLELARSLGRLLGALDDAPPNRIEVRYAGPLKEVIRPLAAGAAVGFLERRIQHPLNLVNALSIAGERGLEIARVRASALSDYTNYVELCAVHGSKRKVVVGGTLLGRRQEPRIVRVGSFRVDTEPHGTCLLIRNRDVPGVIGAVGTVLGEANANIAEYHLARRRDGGQSLGVVRVDGEVPARVLQELCDLDMVEEVRQVAFD